MSSHVRTISANDFEKALHTRIPATTRRDIEAADLRYEDLTKKERDDYVREVVELLIQDDITFAGNHRLPDWERGWSENLERLKHGATVESLLPLYHGKHKYVHWEQEVVRPITPYFDYVIHKILLDWGIQEYLHDVAALYEFGCGPAYHLLRFRKYLPHAHLVGLDWTKASQEIISEISTLGLDKDIEGRRFDFFNPDFSLDFRPNSGLLTVAALEQTGDRFGEFVNFILRKKPRICVHFEPVEELLDENNLIDKLSILYFRKRKYLRGFLTHLRNLESEGRIKILKAQRTYTGSQYIEGHSLVVWTPL